MKRIILCATVLVAVLFFVKCSVSKNTVERNAFSFVILGDMHFDKSEHHDMEYVREKYPNDIGQINNYCRITKENLPGLLNAAKETSTKQKASFWFQLGDFTEGLCGSEILDTKQKTDFIDFIRELKLGIPFFVVKGNHDITGEGARTAYNKVILPWQQNELGMKLESANASFVKGDTRFVILDCYEMDQSLVWLEEILKSHREKHLIVSVHQPIIPYNARSTWHIYAKKSEEQKRGKLLNLLAKHNAIVLTAHLHKFLILKRVVPGVGNIIQLSVASVVDQPNMPLKYHLQGIDNYNEGLLEMEPKFSEQTKEERKNNILKEAPFIKYFEYADMAGYGVISIGSTGSVVLDVYQNMETKKWGSFDLTQIMLN